MGCLKVWLPCRVRCYLLHATRNMNWISIVGFAVIGQCTLMAFKYLLGKKSQQQVLLIALFATIALYLLHEVLVQSRLILQYTLLTGWGPLFPLLIAPILFLYIRSIINPKAKARWIDALHLLPFLIAFFDRINMILLPKAIKVDRLIATFDRFDNMPHTPAPAFTISSFWDLMIWHLQPMIYFGLIIWALYQAKDKIYGSKKLAQWLTFLSIGFLVYFLSNYITEITLPKAFELKKMNVLLPLFSLYVFALCLVIITQSSTSYVVRPLDQDALTSKEIKQYFDKLEEVISTEKPFLKAELQVRDLAWAIGLSGRELSHVIKTTLDYSYSDYINQHRIHHVIGLMKDDHYHHFTMSALGKEAGFGSKDAFYRAFKKETGQTPKVYFDRLKSPKS